MKYMKIESHSEEYNAAEFREEGLKKTAKSP
jgi:hypothetical protein